MKAAPTWDVAVEAGRAVELSDQCFEELLELESVLGGYEDLREPPKWVFGVLRAVRRALASADQANGAALRVRGAFEPASEAPHAA